MKKLLLCIILVFGLIACATSPVDTEHADFIPENRIYNTQYLSKQKDTFALTIKRDTGFLGMAASFSIYLNSTLIAKIKTSEKIVLYLPKDEYILNIDSNYGMKGETIVMDRDRIYRTGVSSVSDLILAPSTF